MSLTPNNLDALLLIILCIFAFLAFLKGFVKEFFSTLNLIIAIVAACLIAPIFANLISIATIPNIVVHIIIKFITFVTILIVCSILSSKISSPLSTKIPSAVNQSLGFGFGFFKGYLILSFCFAILAFFYSNPFSKIPSDTKRNTNSQNLAKSQKFGPQWFQDSKSYNILVYGANFLRPAINNMFSKIEESATNNPLSKKIDLLDKSSKESEDNHKKEQAAPIVKPDESGYNKQDIKKMQRMIEIMSDQTN